MLPFLQIILSLVLMITLAKVGGYISYKLGQPAVVGEVLAGVILGPSVLNFLSWSADGKCITSGGEDETVGIWGTPEIIIIKMSYYF